MITGTLVDNEGDVEMGGGPARDSVSRPSLSGRDSFSRKGDKPDTILGFMTSMGQVHKNPFDKWNRFEIVHVLIKFGFEIRDENYIDMAVLRTYADDMFGDSEVPPKPIPFSVAENKARDVASRKIQNFWVNQSIKMALGDEWTPQDQFMSVVKEAMQREQNVRQPVVTNSGPEVSPLKKQQSVRYEISYKRIKKTLD